jgi:hypothetical protein
VSAAPTVYFHEDQRFRGSMLWTLSAICLGAAIVVAVAAAPREPGVALLTAAILLAVLGLFLVARLETEVRSDSVYVRFHGLWPTRRIPLDDIAGFAARRYTMWESGGWGVHLTMSGMAYNVSGNDGVIFTRKRGGRILVGTQKPDEFAAAIAKALEARRSR